jgi:hypothetical protein
VDGLTAAVAVIAGCLAVVACSADPDPVELQAHFDWDFDPNQTEGTACSLGRAQFIDRSTGDPTRWRWQFPNGTVSADRNPTLDMQGVRSGDVALTVWLSLYAPLCCHLVVNEAFRVVSIARARPVCPHTTTALSPRPNGSH